MCATLASVHPVISQYIDLSATSSFPTLSPCILSRTLFCSLPTDGQCFLLMTISHSSSSLTSSMRYCSLPTSIYDILHYGLVLFIVLILVFVREGSDHRVPNASPDVCDGGSVMGGVRRLFGHGRSESALSFCPPLPLCSEHERCLPLSALLSNGLSLACSTEKCDNPEIMCHFRSTRQSGRGCQTSSKNGSLRMRWEGT